MDIAKPLTNKQLIQESREYHRHAYSGYKEEDIFIDSVPAQRLSYDLPVSDYHFIKVYLEKDNTQIEISAGTSLSEKAQFITTFNQILATFEFVDQ